MILKTIHFLPMGSLTQREEAYWCGFVLIIVNFLIVVGLHLFSIKKALISQLSPTSICLKFVGIGICLAISAYLTMYQLAWSAMHLGQLPLTYENRQLYPSLITLPIMSYTFWPVSIVLLVFMVCSKNRALMTIFLFLTYEAAAGSILYGIKLSRDMYRGKRTFYDPEVIFNFSMILLGVINACIYTSAAMANYQRNHKTNLNNPSSTKLYGFTPSSIMNNYWLQFIERSRADQSSSSIHNDDPRKFPPFSPFQSEIPSLLRATSTSRRLRRPLSYHAVSALRAHPNPNVHRPSQRIHQFDLQPLSNGRFMKNESPDSAYYSRPSSMILHDLLRLKSLIINKWINYKKKKKNKIAIWSRSMSF
uniref:Uncharacterized protein n=1 Tax=Acrobeloides nanus TaxID=290746 RepID=A0A914BWQ6_9BILA